MSRKSNAELALIDNLEHLYGYANLGVVDKVDFLNSLQDIDREAAIVVGSYPKSQLSVVSLLHEAYAKAVDVEVEPPFNNDDNAFLAGKAATYAFLTESAAEARPTNKNTPTNQKAIKTTGKKS